ncbi:hypothetical protein [Salegentibacter echinorum]|uniref:hypothetical protein n=1 Tax=Salegentibacter echinorum TaxID=1073325 RepID=UPI001FEA5E29|nr:hypothetical protein [Salegentibacter echinorum]
MLLAFMALVLTRYVYAVLGLLVAYILFGYFKNLIVNKDYKKVSRIVILGSLCALPLLFWFKYIYILEKDVDTGLSYFTRFKNNELLYNLKAGIGLIKHEEVGKVNGIPAFISLFIPITGIRNWIISCFLILTFTTGYLVNLKKHSSFNKLFAAIMLVMTGLVLAGTGFSRYWLIMLPGFLLGFYLFFNYLKLKDSLFVLLAKLIAIIYVINELRLDYVVLSKL